MVSKASHVLRVCIHWTHAYKVSDINESVQNDQTVSALAFIPSVYLLRLVLLLSSNLQLLLRMSVLSSWSSLLTNHASSTRSKQATHTDKQTITTKNKHQSKEKLRRGALNDTAIATIVTTRERLRTELSLNGHDYRGSKCNGEDDYMLVVF